MYISIDIGGTNTRVLATSDLDNPNFENIHVFDTEINYKNGVEKIIEIIKIFTDTPKAIAIGIAGGVDESSQIMTGSNVLTDWEHEPLIETLQTHFSCPTYLRNDAVMGALGEAYYGTNKKDDFIYLTLGTGLGGAIVERKDENVNVFRPKDRSELYELETKIGGTECEKKYGKPMKSLSNDAWQEVINNLAEGVDVLASSKNWGKNTFVLGGGIVERQKIRFQKLLKQKNPKICLTTLGDKSGLYGGLALIKQQNVITNNKIKFIYFDIGGVAILDFSKTNKWHELASALGVSESDIDKFNNLFAEFEPGICVGKKDLLDFVKEAKKLLGLGISDDHDMLGEFVDRFEVNISIHSIIDKLGINFKLGLLTNMYPNMLDRIKERHLLPKAKWDVVIDSSVIGLRKPQDEIYQFAEEKAGVNPKNILFIENSISHIEVAKRRGWQTLLYDTSNIQESNEALIKLVGI